MTPIGLRSVSGSLFHNEDRSQASILRLQAMGGSQKTWLVALVTAGGDGVVSGEVVSRGKKRCAVCEDTRSYPRSH